MISVREAFEIIVTDEWNKGTDTFIDSLLTFMQLSQAQQLQVLKNRVAAKVAEKKAQRDVILPNAQAAHDTVQAEIDELQAFIDN